MFCEGQDLGIDVYKNMLFEKLYVPRQYHPEFIKMLLVGMFRQEYEKCRPELRSYSFSCYLKVAFYILPTIQWANNIFQERIARKLFRW